MKGFQDPDLEWLQRQSPTPTADGLAVTVQTIASMQWKLGIADVEGAFLQGEPLHRDRGRIFAELSADKPEGVETNDLVELNEVVEEHHNHFEESWNAAK